MRTRFAPSPTGNLHLGGVWTALASWAVARSVAGSVVLRVEDIDTPRVVQGAGERILEDLAWLGLDWDGAPVLQSSRTEAYEAALAELGRAGLTYPCDCSRAEIARAASAPHAGEEGKETTYPGTCRDAPRDREFKRPPAIRLRVPETRVSFEDGIHGPIEEDVAAVVGDFVLRRGDGVFAYQLVVAIDDAAMDVTTVVRADDLLGSTARQLLLMRLLGHAKVPSYVHVPLVVAPDGERLAKRAPRATVRELIARGIGREEMIETLARGLGLVDEARAVRSPADVAAALRPPRQWRRAPWPLPSAWLA